MPASPLLELRFPQRSPALTPVLALLGGGPVVALVVTAVQLARGAASGTLLVATLSVIVIFPPCAWLVWRSSKGPEPAFTAEGIRLKVASWDRDAVVVPWSRVERVQIRTIGAAGYRFVVVTAADGAVRLAANPLTRPFRTLTLGLTARSHGTPLHFWLNTDAVGEYRVMEAAHQLSGGRVRVEPVAPAAATRAA